MISQELINEIRNKTDIVELISEYIPLEQKGKNYFAVCPFHDDHNPSMSISKEKQIYTCFVCGAHGNVFTFVMDYENISFVESVKLLGSKMGIKIDIKENVEKQYTDLETKLYEIHDIANKYFQNNLRTSKGLEALNYLKNREINEELIKEFEIGVSIDSNLSKLLLSKYDKDLLLKTGIINENSNETFINRIIFPIYDTNNKLVAFSGRTYNNDSSSKYINSKESEIFKKGKVLYNYYKCKDEVRRSKTLIITEGFMDVIALYKNNIKNVVATMGTAITTDYANLIKKLSNNVVLCFDGDNAGEKATISCINELIKHNIFPKVVRLKDLDPDEYIKKYNVDKFENEIKNAKNYLDFKIEYYRKSTNFDNSSDVSNYIKSVIDELEFVNDKLIREMVLRKLSDEVNISINTLDKMIKQEKIEYNNKVVEQPKLLNKYEKAEMRLLYYMLRHEEVIKIFKNNKSYMPTQSYRYLCNEILYYYKKYNNINIADFISFLEDKKDLLEALSKINSITVNENYSSEEINDYINLLNTYSIEREIKRLTNLFKSETDEMKKAEIGKKISELKVSV